VFQVSRGNPLHLAPKPQVFLPRKFLIERQILRHHTNHPADGHLILLDVKAVDRGRARCCTDQGVQDRNGRSLPCPVWPQKAEDFPFLNLKLDIIHGIKIRAVITLDKVFHFNKGHCFSLTGRQTNINF